MTKRKHPGRSSGPVRPESPPFSEGRRPPRSPAKPAASKRLEASKTADKRAEGSKWADGRYVKGPESGPSAKAHPQGRNRTDSRLEPGTYPKSRPEAGKYSARPMGKPAKMRPDSRREPDREPPAERPRAPETAAKAGKQGRGNWLYGLHAVKAALDNPRRKILRVLLTEEAVAAIGGNRSSFKEMYPKIVVETVIREAISQMLPAHAVHQGALVVRVAQPVGREVRATLAAHGVAVALLLQGGRYGHGRVDARKRAIQS